MTLDSLIRGNMQNISYLCQRQLCSPGEGVPKGHSLTAFITPDFFQSLLIATDTENALKTLKNQFFSYKNVNIILSTRILRFFPPEDFNSDILLYFSQVKQQKSIYLYTFLPHLFNHL